MPNTNFHFVQLLVPQNKQNDFRDEMRKKAFDIASERGFIQRDAFLPQNGVSFRLIHPKTIKAKTFDPKSRDWSNEQWERHWATDAVFDFEAGMAFVIGTRAGVKILQKYFSSEFKTPVQLASVEIDIVPMLEAVREAYDKLEVKKINLSEFVAPEKLSSRGAFKVLKNSDDVKFIERWKTYVTAWSVTIPDGSDKLKLTVNNKGSMSITDSAPGGVIDIIKDIFYDHVTLLQSEEEEETETVNVPPPAPVHQPQALEV